MGWTLIAMIADTVTVESLEGCSMTDKSGCPRLLRAPASHTPRFEVDLQHRGFTRGLVPSLHFREEQPWLGGDCRPGTSGGWLAALILCATTVVFVPSSFWHKDWHDGFQNGSAVGDRRGLSLLDDSRGSIPSETR